MIFLIDKDTNAGQTKGWDGRNMEDVCYINYSVAYMFVCSSIEGTIFTFKFGLQNVQHYLNLQAILCTYASDRFPILVIVG